MKNEAKANEEADKKVRERVEKLNMADGLVFNSEKQLKEYGDKLPADEKKKIEDAVTKLKEAHKAEDMDTIDKAMEDLNNAWQAASQHLYNAQQGAGDGQPGAQAQQEGGAGNANDVSDVEFEEVKEDK